MGKGIGSELMYIFDRATGALRYRIEGLPNAINHLAYAPDGRHLAVALGGADGLRVYETEMYREVARDAEYSERTYWAAFDDSGRLVTTSHDGHVRLYNAAFQLRRKARTPGGRKPSAAVFSPDGRSIAVGYNDGTRVDVLDSMDLTDLFGSNEMSRSLAIAPDGQRFLLGTEWHLRLFDRDGAQHWQVATPGIAWAVTVTPDGHTAIVGLGDGTLRWYRLQNGVKLLALFAHADGRRWVL
jgi:WD40 repeat protein